MNMPHSFKSILILTAAVSAFFSCAGDLEPVVMTEYGAVLGENRDGVAIFRGIPYGGSVKLSDLEIVYPFDRI